MLKKILIVGILSFVIVFNSYAKDNDQTDLLTKEIQDIKLRLTRVEALLNNPGSVEEHATSGDGWKSVKNWRKLSTEMDFSAVQNILGEPQRIDGGNVAYWYYENGGRVVFITGKVTQWTEPKQ